MIIPHQCIVKHDPPHSYGDCFRACIASLLGFMNITDVPHFLADGDQDNSDALLRSFLASRGLRPFVIGIPGAVPLSELFVMMKKCNAGVEYLLFCNCGGGDHVVICRDDQVIHNPAWVRSEIEGPTTDENLWGILVLVPINP